MTTGKIPILDLTAQYQTLAPEIHQAIERILESGQFILGPEVKAFEEEVAAYLGVAHAIGVNSGTDALVISLRSLGIGPGDEVITTPFSFFATAESISNVGAKPVFVDVDLDTFNLNPALIKAAITPQTKAILPVHLFGQPAAMGEIIEIAAAHNLVILEDCAQSFGAIYTATCPDCHCSQATQDRLRNKFTGTLGTMGAFSFFPTKNLGAYGDGGLIVTDDPELAQLARMLRVHGSKKRYHNELLGYNSRLDSLQAAILRVKLPHIDQWNQQRRRVAQTYNEHLRHVPGLITPQITPGHVFHQYTLRVLDGKRQGLMDALGTQAISTMVYYPIPQDRLPIYQGQYPAYPVSDRLASEVLSLPIWPELNEPTIIHIAEAIKTFLA
ncbi:DegT/DnrJ/EryC1/StrS family aminotransferase [Candidatus Synechococcus calcipolaris G9]|uniref:DegT/DnrJ/EryC1/StrS family aminotransferase n=1 Tax=Candidatus Synechococcus calcipolaris G9 TaxID=1497997 RepID=A0ABT6F175_9SYNE|nr:DegT/DnrJ/EryC1/StrS family aminotransferase [Candidatus Synechococcus calcipolaris]MDG2991608.1 DegT/DnrJ/EryC1/StrS family aminotransferase [Candidatus Synechococcus calcipolaris G9]